MKITKQVRRDAKQLLRSCRVNDLLDEDRVRRALQAVLARKPRGYVSLLQHFQHLVQLDLERHQAHIESPTPLPASQQASLQANLSRHYGSGLSFSFVTNPALIGGMRIRVASDVYDNSIAGRLAALQDSINR